MHKDLIQYPSSLKFVLLSVVATIGVMSLNIISPRWTQLSLSGKLLGKENSMKYSGTPLKGHPWCVATLSIMATHFGPIVIQIALKKPLFWGHPSIMANTLFPNGGHYRGVPLYIQGLSSLRSLSPCWVCSNILQMLTECSVDVL